MRPMPVATRTGQAVATALRVRRRRGLAAALAVAYLVLYLWSIGDLVVARADFGRFVAIPSAEVVADWSSKLFQQRAPYYYEPVLALYPHSQVQILVSPLNVAMGGLLGVLVGLNLAVALHVFTTARTCRASVFTGVFGAVPGMLTGFACCVPTLALVLGAQLTAGLVAVRTWFFPLALVALLAALAWNARRALTVEAPSGGPS